MKPRCPKRPYLRSLILFLTLVMLGSTAGAQTDVDCLIGPGMGATLLIPYFEVDLDDLSGPNTIVSINNGLSSDTMARVTLWSDWGVATFGFDLFIPAFDVVPISLRDVLAGRVPSTGDGFNLRDFDSCETFPPVYSDPLLNATDRDQLRADHTGQLGPRFTSCVGSDTGDNIARGYITVDSAGTCSTAEIDPEVNPSLDNYFVDGGGGIADNNNRLWGDVIYLDPAGNSAQGSEAISLWADPNRFDGSDRPTFYGRLRGFSADDDRVPLPRLWNQRFLNGGSFQGGADLIVFRNPAAPGAPVSCDSTPEQFPLVADLFALDESGGNLIDVSAANPVGLATQRVSIDAFNIPYNFGWLQVDSSVGAWVQPTLKAGNDFSAAFNGAASGGFQCDDRVAVSPDSGAEEEATAHLRRTPRVH